MDTAQVEEARKMRPTGKHQQDALHNFSVKHEHRMTGPSWWRGGDALIRGSESTETLETPLSFSWNLPGIFLPTPSQVSEIPIPFPRIINLPGDGVAAQGPGLRHPLPTGNQRAGL